MSLGDVPLLQFLARRPQPVWVNRAGEIANPLDALKPHWTNAAYGQLDETGVEWQQITFNLHHRCIDRPSDPEACTTVSSNWILVATLLDEGYVVVTATRRLDAGPRQAIHADLALFQPPTLVPQLALDPQLTELWSRTGMGRMVLQFPWDNTPLGPISDWSESTKMLVSMTLEWPERLCIYLGDEMIAIYNDNYIKVLGQKKHARALGRSYKDVHPEIWEALEGYCYRALAGDVIYHRDNLVLMDREPTGMGMGEAMGLEETYHIWSFVPVRVESSVVGFINESSETTTRVIAERRVHTLRALSIATSLATSQELFFNATLDVLAKNAIDFPFVIMYSVHPLPDRERYQLVFHSALGVPHGHSAAPSTLTVRVKSANKKTSSTTSSSTAATKQPVTTPWPFVECLTTQRVVNVPNIGKITEGLERRGWDKQCEDAVMFTVNAGSKEDAPALVIIAGLNPCRPFDDDYRGFIDLLVKQISSGLTMVLTFEMAQKKAEELASLDRAKTVFFSNVSHELRTPLTLIMGPLDDILSEPSDSPLSNAKGRLKVVARHAAKLHGLVNSLLDFARLEAGRYLASFRPVDLGALTADIASLFRSAIERGRVSYTVDCVNGKEVYVDTDAWEKVVTNIISNAFKYCLEGTIEVRVEYTKTEAVFSCSDTGCGIPASDLSYIFNRFHRVETVGARSIEGTGVGLALTYETVKSLGGDIDVRSEVGVGSTFTVRLPLGNAHIPPERIVSDPPMETSAGEHEPLRYSMRIVEEAHGWLASDTSGESNRGSAAGRDSSVSERGSTATDDRGLHLENSVVIIADDNPDLRHYCVNLLSPKYIVKAFPNGQAALDYVLHNDTDLVLSDVQMPLLDGYGFLHAVRSRKETTLLPFILLSAAAGSEARIEGLSAGADDYLVKPFASKELLARVRTHLELGRLRRELEARVQDRTRLLVESETRLLEQIAESEHMRKQQEIVVDLTSHELRNPLNAIWQNAELIQSALARIRSRTGPDLQGTLEEADDAVQNIVLSVAHQTRIADDILNFSKISMSLLTIHREPFLLFDTVQDVLRMWEIETRERDIKLELKAPEALRHIWVNTDPHRCAQILINFLTNAIRFTSDSPTRNITVFLESFTHVDPPGPNVFRVAPDNPVFPDGFWLRIGVQDSGSGLSPDEREKLFERFAQAHPSKDQFSGGHGLGLFVSRHIVLLLSGYIDVESTKGDGCTFSFSIPVERTGPQEGYDRTKLWRGRRPLGRSPKPYHDGPPSAVARTLSGNVRPRQVLIVEDNIINQKVLTRQLQAKGFHTSVANDGQEALDRIFEGDSAPDVVLMDIEMPVKDGKAACRELRDREARDALPRLPVIAVTGNARDEQIEECLQVGFDDCVIKPYRIADIVSTIDRFLAPRDFPTALASLPSSAPTSPDVSTKEPILG